MIWHFLVEDGKLISAVYDAESILHPENWVTADIDGEPMHDCGIAYKLVDGTVVKKTDAEIAAEQIAQPTDADRLDAIEAAICDLAEMLLGGADNG